jgi:hypothetical protein
MILQNLGNTNEYCVGAYTCEVPSTSLVFLLKGVSIAFWTIVLNSLCQTGYRTLSWLLVILPFIGGALAIALLMMSGGIREGATGSIIAESNTLAVADDASTTQVEAAETVLEEAEAKAKAEAEAEAAARAFY